MELANIKVPDIDWEHRIIRVLGKGNKEGYAPFGSLSERYLKTWLKNIGREPKTIFGESSGEAFNRCLNLLDKLLASLATLTPSVEHSLVYLERLE